jgi:hypothetical protein
MRTGSRRHLTWSRIGAAISVALIAFGVLTALLPHHTGSAPTLMPVPPTTLNNRVANLGDRTLAAPQTAVQQVAVRFVTACDTTDPAQPHGDVATQAALAPSLVLPHDVAEPAAWKSETRSTTVALDPPGQPVTERGDTVAVIVTGTISVTADSGPAQRVPIAERIALRPLNDDHSAGDHSIGNRETSGWHVVGVEVGA